jgi:hypothetical protein
MIEQNIEPPQSRTFTCRLDDGTAEGFIAEGLVIKSSEGKLSTFDVQAFVKTRFYTFCIAEQPDKGYLVRLVKVHDRTGTFISLKTLLMSNTSVEQLFENVLNSLLAES